jgi:hypothetical protein
MISTMKSDKKTTIRDDRAALVKDYSEAVYDLVLFALRSGLREFTIPTEDNDQVRLDWKTRVWVVDLGSGPKAFIVACLEPDEHLEIVGPEISLDRPASIERAKEKDKSEK